MAQKIVEVEAAVEIAHRRADHAARHQLRRQWHRPDIGVGVAAALIQILEQHARGIRFEALRVSLRLLAAQRVARARERELAAIEQARDQHDR